MAGSKLRLFARPSANGSPTWIPEKFPIPGSRHESDVSSTGFSLWILILYEEKDRGLKRWREKGSYSFCHSKRSEESLLLFRGKNRREVPRFARIDKINYLSTRL